MSESKRKDGRGYVRTREGIGYVYVRARSKERLCKSKTKGEVM